MPRRAVIPVLLILSSCSSGSARFDVPPGGYARSFDAARGVLRSNGFALDRIDAQGGVITTRPKMTGGLATPWDTEQSSLVQEVEDFIHQQQRRVRVTFDNPGDGPGAARVEVVVERRYVRGWQPSTKAILYSGTSIDPQAQAEGRPGEYDVAISRDDRLAGRLAKEIARAGAR